MPDLRRFLSRRCLLAYLGGAALLFGLAMLHPYPRQSLFGPTIRGKPRCVWEDAIRRQVNWEEYEKTWAPTLLGWMGVKHEPMELRVLLNHPEMLPLALELAEDQDRGMRGEILFTLTFCDKLRDPSVLPVLRRRLEDDDAYCRIQAARALWHIAKDKQGFAVVLRDLEDCRDESVRREAIWLFHEASAASPELYPVLAAHAKHPSPGIRREVMLSMGKFGKKGLPILRQGLEDSDLDVRFCAVIALEQLGPDAKEAVPALERRLTETDAGLRGRTAEALKMIDPQRFRQLKAERKIE